MTAVEVREMMAGNVEGWVNDGVEMLDEGGKPMGWCCRDMVAAMGKAGKGAGLVVDGGCWTGRSAYEWSLCTPKGCAIVCIDHWRGSAEHHDNELLSGLYGHFCANMKVLGLRDRVVPIRKGSVFGMMAMRRAGLVPDAMTVDWSHDAISVFADVTMALTLFPKAKLVLDDWTRESVREGATKAMEGFADTHVLTPHGKAAMVELEKRLGN